MIACDDCWRYWTETSRPERIARHVIHGRYGPRYLCNECFTRHAQEGMR